MLKLNSKTEFGQCFCRNSVNQKISLEEFAVYSTFSGFKLQFSQKLKLTLFLLCIKNEVSP